MAVELERGGCVVFAWGPPWHWLPTLQGSKYGFGWSLTWLWFGLYFVPKPIGWLFVGAGLHWLKNDIRPPITALEP